MTNPTRHPGSIALFRRWRNHRRSHRRDHRRAAAMLRGNPHLARDIGMPDPVAAPPRLWHDPAGPLPRRRSPHPLVRRRKR